MNPSATVLSIDHFGRGVARPNGKTTFIGNALPQETVRYRVETEKAAFDEAQATEILAVSPYRRTPRCPHYGDCGGCALQHAEFSAQIAFKQRIFEEQIARIGKVSPDILLPPVYGLPWHYRERTRLSVQTEGGRVLLGYRGRKSHRTVAVSECPVLPAHVSSKLPEIRDGLQTLHDAAPDSGIAAVSVHCADALTALTVHSRKKLPEKLLVAFSGSLNGNRTPVWQIWQQTGSRPAEAVAPQGLPPPSYTLPDYGIKLPYRVGDFTQINRATNALMVSRALHLLDPQPGERIADLFCGLGNFSLPIARSGAQVLGIEGDAALTARARSNARFNNITNAEFATADLFDTSPQTVASWGRIDKILLDPPRAGALAVVRSLHAPLRPQRVVYVSCNPATFARDAATLVRQGYRFRAAGIINMFAQTAHVEAVSLFESE